MVYDSEEIEDGGFIVSENDVVKKLVFRKNNGNLHEVSLPDPAVIRKAASKTYAQQEASSIALAVPSGANLIFPGLRSTAAIMTGIGSSVVVSKKSSNGNVLQKSGANNGATWTDAFDFGESITGILKLPSGRILVATGTINAGSVTTFIHLWRSSDATATSFSRVDGDVLINGGYVVPWGMSALGDVVLVVAYGYKVGTGVNKSRYGWVSTDGGATWAQALDIGGVDNRHVHGAHIDSLGVMWVSTGDDTGNVNSQAVWRSADNGATWTPHFIVDEYGATVQLTGITDTADLNGWVYGIQDSGSGNNPRVWRWQSADFDDSLEVTYDAGTTTANQSSPWKGLGYVMGRDPVNNVLYAYIPGFAGSQTTARGRIMYSLDGVRWRVLMETARSVLSTPSTVAKFDFGNANIVFYDNFYWPTLIPYKQKGMGRSRAIRISRRIDGTLAANITSAIRLDPALEQLGFVRVTNLYLYLDSASATQAITASVRRGASTALVATPATVAAGATGLGLQSAAVIANTPATVSSGALSHAEGVFHVDLNVNGSADAVGAVLVLELEQVSDTGWLTANTV